MRVTNKHWVFLMVFAVLFVTGITGAVTAAEKTRDQIDDKYKWDLSDIYPDWEAWEADFGVLDKVMDDYIALRGKLNQSSDNLARAFELSDELDRILYKVYRYPGLARALDMRDDEVSGRFQKVQIWLAKFSTATAWFEPEMLAIQWETMETWLNENKRLAPYRFGIEDSYRQQEHVLDENSERLLSYYSPLRRSPRAAYNELSTSDIKYPDVVLGEVDTITMTPGQYRFVLATNRNQADRGKAFEAYYGAYAANANTYAALYNGVLQRDWATAQARNYNSCLESYLHSNNVPVAVYENLIAAVRDGVAPLQKYYALRKKILGLEEYHGYDGSIPIVDFERTYEYDEVIDWILDAVKPLGDEYQKNIRRVLENRWVDVYETAGKATGAFSGNVYGVHPYILMNYNKTLDNVFTLAHEAGHAVHSMLSDQYQPKATSSYTLFVAEVASTMNEALLLDFMLERARDPIERVALLQQAIDNIEGTFYAQVMFADYELQAHRLVEQGQPVTATALTEIYTNLLKAQHGEGFTFDELYGSTWTRISHFYDVPFYVYKYATSYAASAKLFRDITSADKKIAGPALDRYLTLLKSGGNDYPVEQLKKAGVDLTKPEAIQGVMAQLDDLVTRLETEMAKL